MQKVAIIGTTSWGITLATLLVKKGVEIRLWARTAREANKLKKTGTDRFPGITIPKGIVITPKMEVALENANAVILAVPSATMRENISRTAKHLTKSTIIISASKGLEIGSNKRMSEVIAEEINPRFHNNICVLSGPQLAREIMDDHPAASVVASDYRNTIYGRFPDGRGSPAAFLHALELAAGGPFAGILPGDGAAGGLSVVCA